jgi:5-methylcytosine-specific restriction endonuclease McrA
VKLTDEEKAERNRQHNKVYYLKNREAEISRKLAYAKTPAGKASRARSRHKKITEDPERYRADQRTRRHNARFKKLGLPGIHTTDEWYAVVAAQDGKCNHCGEKKELTRDHIVPPSNGGSNWIENIQGLCWECNTAKGEMPWEEFHGLGPLFSD